MLREITIDLRDVSPCEYCLAGETGIKHRPPSIVGRSWETYWFPGHSTCVPYDSVASEAERLHISIDEYFSSQVAVYLNDLMLRGQKMLVWIKSTQDSFILFFCSHEESPGCHLQHHSYAGNHDIVHADAEPFMLCDGKDIYRVYFRNSTIASGKRLVYDLAMIGPCKLLDLDTNPNLRDDVNLSESVDYSDVPDDPTWDLTWKSIKMRVQRRLCVLYSGRCACLTVSPSYVPQFIFPPIREGMGLLDLDMLSKIGVRPAFRWNPATHGMAGRTFLMWASLIGHSDTVRSLLDDDTDLDKKDRMGNTALTFSALNDHWDVIGMLRARFAGIGNALVLASQYGRVGAVLQFCIHAAFDSRPQYNPALRAAAEGGRLLVAKFLVGEGADPNFIEDHGDEGTALALAARQGHKDMVVQLIADGADPNAKAVSGWTALSEAVERNRIGVIKRLLDAGADPNATDICGRTPLGAAVRFGSLKIVDMFLKAGTDPNTGSWLGAPAVMEASRNGYAEIVNRLVEAGANPNAMDALGSTALREAALEGRTDIVKELLRAGADPNATGSNIATPLIAASGNGHLDVVEHLLQAGADPCVTDSLGWNAYEAANIMGYARVVELLSRQGYRPGSPPQTCDMTLTTAAGTGRNELVKQVLDFGADPNAADPPGVSYAGSMMGHIEEANLLRTVDGLALEELASLRAGLPLVAAAGTGRVTVVRLLLESGANPNNIDGKGRTPLSWATWHGQSEVVDELLKAGADPNFNILYTHIPLWLAAQRGFVPLVTRLIAAGADPNAIASTEESVLAVAARNGFSQIVKQLLKAGAKPPKEGDFGKSPFELAVRYGHVKIIKYLLKRGVRPVMVV